MSTRWPRRWPRLARLRPRGRGDAGGPRRRAAELHVGAGPPICRRALPRGRWHDAEPVAIGVNLFWLVPGVVGGSEDYTVRAARRVHRAGPAGRQRDHPVRQLVVPAAHPGLVDASRGRGADDRCTASRRGSRRKPPGSPARPGQRHGPRPPRRWHHPVAHATPGLVTIHDLQPLRLPDNFSGLKQVYLRSTSRGRRGRAVIVVSPTEHTRHDVVDARRGPRAHLRRPTRLTRRPPVHDADDEARVRDGLPWASIRTSSIRRSPIPTRTT